MINMSRIIRETVPVITYGMRKEPSEDLRVVPDKNITSVPKTSSLLLKADGNEGKVYQTIGRSNRESERPAIELGLTKGREIGANSFTALSHADSVFLAALLSDVNTARDTFCVADSESEDAGTFLVNLWGQPEGKLRTNLKLTRAWLVKPTADIEGFVGINNTAGRNRPITTADHVLGVNILSARARIVTGKHT